MYGPSRRSPFALACVGRMRKVRCDTHTHIPCGHARRPVFSERAGFGGVARCLHAANLAYSSLTPSTSLQHQGGVMYTAAGARKKKKQQRPHSEVTPEDSEIFYDLCQFLKTSNQIVPPDLGSVVVMRVEQE